MEYMGTKEAAETWGYTQGTISKWCRQGQLYRVIKPEKRGGQWRSTINVKYSQQRRHDFKKYFIEDRIKAVPNKLIPFHLVSDSQESHEAFWNCKIPQCIQKQTDIIP